MQHETPSSPIPLRDLVSRKDSLSSRKLLLETLKQRFLDHFASRGYEIQPPQSVLCPDGDPTFTSATMTHHKNQIVEGITGKGIALVQQCVRLQNVNDYNELARSGREPEYMSHFSMIGVTASPGGDVFHDVWTVLTRSFGVPSSDIIVKVSDKDPDLIAGFRAAGAYDNLRVIPDEERLSYFQWKYGSASGMSDVIGRGVTFAIRDSSSGQFLDIGNLIAMKKASETLAYEAGIGVETSAARIVGKKYPFNVSYVGMMISDYLSSRETEYTPQWAIVGDAVAACAAIMQEGIYPRSNGTASERALWRTLNRGKEVAQTYCLLDEKGFVDLVRNMADYYLQGMMPTQVPALAALNIERVSSSLEEKTVAPLRRVQDTAELRTFSDDELLQFNNRSHTCQQLTAEFTSLEDTNVQCTGRVVGIRHIGRLAFVDFEDETGQVQLMLTPEGLGADFVKSFESAHKVGDIVSVTGSLMKSSKTQQVTVKASTWLKR